MLTPHDEAFSFPRKCQFCTPSVPKLLSLPLEFLILKYLSYKHKTQGSRTNILQQREYVCKWCCIISESHRKHLSTERYHMVQTTWFKWSKSQSSHLIYHQNKCYIFLFVNLSDFIKSTCTCPPCKYANGDTLRNHKCGFIWFGIWIVTPQYVLHVLCIELQLILTRYSFQIT